MALMLLGLCLLPSFHAHTCPPPYHLPAHPPTHLYTLQIAGIAFPLPIMALVPLRQYVLPRLFPPAALAELDRAEYEEAAALPHAQAVEVRAGLC